MDDGIKIFEMLAVMFVCKTFNEIVHQNKRFCEYLNLSDQIICKSMLMKFSLVIL